MKTNFNQNDQSKPKIFFYNDEARAENIHIKQSTADEKVKHEEELREKTVVSVCLLITSVC